MKIIQTYLVISLVLTSFLIDISSAQFLGGIFGGGDTTPAPRKDREFQTRRYRCDYDSGIAKKCVCIIKVVKKKMGNLFKNLGCEIFSPVDDLMMEVNAVYNFTTVNVLNTDLFGNTCPVGTDDQFMYFANIVKDFSLNLAQPCPLPALGRYSSVDADFDAGLVEAISPILPTGAYNAYVRVYRAGENKTLAYQTLYGSTPIFDLTSIPIVNSIMNFFG